MPGHLIPSKEPQGGRFSSISKSETDIHELHLLLSRSRYLEPLPRGEINSVRVSGRGELVANPWARHELSLFDSELLFFLF